jgi:F-type H+-transporting ATPase subunit epsilon
MKLEIITPTKTINENDVEFVSMDGTEGSFGVLKGHMPMLSALKIAPLHYNKAGAAEAVAVMGGIARVFKDTVTVLTEDAERAMEIDVLKARKDKEDAEAYLTKKVEMTDMINAEIQLRKALVRLRVAERGKRI